MLFAGGFGYAVNRCGGTGTPVSSADEVVDGFSLSESAGWVYVCRSWGRTGTLSVVGVRHSSPDPFKAIILLICFRVSSFCSVSAGGVLS